MSAHAFGRDTSWVAFADVTPEDAAELLGLRSASHVPWDLALDLSQHNGTLAVTPPLPGLGGKWVLATGLELCDGRLDIAALSRETGGAVQHYAAYDSVRFYMWRRACAGIMSRSFTWAAEYSEVLDWYGQPDAVERLVGLPAHGSVSAATSATIAAGTIGSRSVMRIARQWSLDPSALSGPAPALPYLGTYAAGQTAVAS
jgi:hypothetical protein